MRQARVREHATMPSVTALQPNRFEVRGTEILLLLSFPLSPTGGFISATRALSMESERLVVLTNDIEYTDGDVCSINNYLSDDSIAALIRAGSRMLSSSSGTYSTYKLRE